MTSLSSLTQPFIAHISTNIHPSKSTINTHLYIATNPIPVSRALLSGSAILPLPPPHLFIVHQHPLAGLSSYSLHSSTPLQHLSGVILPVRAPLPLPQFFVQAPNLSQLSSTTRFFLRYSSRFQDCYLSSLWALSLWIPPRFMFVLRHLAHSFPTTYSTLLLLSPPPPTLLPLSRSPLFSKLLPIPRALFTLLPRFFLLTLAPSLLSCPTFS